jgi:hypothetical protein
MVVFTPRRLRGMSSVSGDFLSVVSAARMAMACGICCWNVSDSRWNQDGAANGNRVKHTCGRNGVERGGGQTDVAEMGRMGTPCEERGRSEYGPLPFYLLSLFRGATSCCHRCNIAPIPASPPSQPKSTIACLLGLSVEKRPPAWLRGEIKGDAEAVSRQRGTFRKG